MGNLWCSSDCVKHNTESAARIASCLAMRGRWEGGK